MPAMTVQDDYRDALEAMVWQFGVRTTRGKQRLIGAGGLSVLEDAFMLLGWDDPHVVAEGGCEIAGCEEWATCAGPYPRAAAKPHVPPDRAGFGFLCGAHFREWRDAVTPGVGRIKS